LAVAVDFPEDLRLADRTQLKHFEELLVELRLEEGLHRLVILDLLVKVGLDLQLQLASSVEFAINLVLPWPLIIQVG
jgi:hypothetical protein